MDQQVPKAVERFFRESVWQQFKCNWQQAARSGAIPEGTPDLAIAKILLQMTARDFAPMSKDYQVLAKNLEHFV
jgi:hypothetical protein